jgi:cobalt-zinc-cadmium efflux system outer membrane protein
MVQVGVPLQIFDRNQGTILRAQAELGVAREEVRRVALALQERLTEAFRQYSNARQQFERYQKEILPDARQTLELTRKGYDQGEYNYLQLLTAQRTFFGVNLAFLESWRELALTTTRIRGFLLTGGLQPVETEPSGADETPGPLPEPFLPAGR